MTVSPTARGVGGTSGKGLVSQRRREGRQAGFKPAEERVQARILAGAGL